MSPPDTAHLDVNGLHVEISYSRPSVRGRVIFGSEDEGALQPYGSYWRVGANEATTITLNQDVTFNGMQLKAGSYSLYAIPGPDSFQIGVNTETGQWGAWEPDFSKNVFVTDGACMTSAAAQNPSLTYMALTARAAAFAVEELKKKNL